MQGWPYECCHWYFVVCALPLSYLVVFSNNGFQFVTELETSKSKNLEGLFLVSFFSVLGRNPFFGISCFICQKKYYLPSPDKQGGNCNCMWILTGTRSELGWLKSRCLPAFALESHHNQIFLSLLQNVFECSFICLKKRE